MFLSEWTLLAQEPSIPFCTTRLREERFLSHTNYIFSKGTLDTSAEFCGSRTHIIPKLSKFVFLKQFIWSDNIFVNSNSWTTNSSMRCLIHVQRLTDFLTEGHEHAIHIVQLTVIWCQTKYIALHQTKLHNQCTWCAPFILENTQTLEFQVASVLCCHKADT